jgi:hypothetical protein
MPDREEKYLFSEHEVGRQPMCVFVRKNDDRFAFGESGQLGRNDFWRRTGQHGPRTCSPISAASYGIDPQIRLYPNLDAIKNGLKAGTIDAGLYGAPTVEGFRTIQNFCSAAVLFCV